MQDARVIADVYHACTQRNSNLLLNLSPDTSGGFAGRSGQNATTGSEAHSNGQQPAVGLDERTLASDLDLEAADLVSHLEAAARAVPALRAEDVIAISNGEPMEKWADRDHRARSGFR